MKRNKLILASALVLMTGCAGDFDTNFMTDKPANTAMQEFVSQYDVLKSYAGSMRIGAEAPQNALLNHSTPATQLETNFNEVTLTDVFSHKALVNGAGTVDSTKAKAVVDDATERGLSLVGTSLCSPSTTNVAYMNQVVADTYIPGQPAIGEFTLLDFEDMPLNTQINGSGGAPGVIVEDPMGESGHVYQYKGVFNHPMFDITLPQGVTVGDIIEGYCDFLIVSTGWVPASVLKVFINGKQCGGDLGTSAVNQGCVKGEWGRGKYHLNFGLIEFTDEEKKATSFQLGMGDVCDNPNYYIDNLKIKAHYTEDGHVEVRPIEEKKADALKALDNYLKNTVGRYGDQVDTWIIASDALAPGNSGALLLDSKNDADASKFHWNEYLGENFVADLAKHALALKPSLQLLYSEKNLDGDAQKTANLVKLLKQWNAAGAKLDGVNAELHLKYNASTVASQKTNIENMLKTLVGSGLKVRLSGLDMQAVDAAGVARKISDLNLNELEAMSDFYNSVVKAYLTIVPEPQRYGISLQQITGSDYTIGLWASDYNRQPSYAGVADGLQNLATSWDLK